MVPSKKVWVTPHLNSPEGRVKQREVNLPCQQIDNGLVISDVNKNIFYLWGGGTV